MHEDETEIRKAIIYYARLLEPDELSKGTSGNISVRAGSYCLITPSAISYDLMKEEMLAKIPLIKLNDEYEGPIKPSSEWRFHRDIMLCSEQVGAVIHAHPPYCTALAISRKDIPPCHYMVALFGGEDVRCADYALYGTEELSKAVLKALSGRKACLMANHGALTVGHDLKEAMDLMIALEDLARQYFYSLCIGGPTLLSAHEIEQVQQKIKTYKSAAVSSFSD